MASRLPCQLVGYVHDDRTDGRDRGCMAGRGDVPSGPERDRKNLGGSDQPPRDGLRNRPAHREARLFDWLEFAGPSRVLRCTRLGNDHGDIEVTVVIATEFRRGP
jgi:hypothetical protein